MHYFLILVNYIRPLSEVDSHLQAHRDFLKTHYDAGHFLMSGARHPRDGGVILAQAPDVDTVAQWMKHDPFSVASVAEYQIIQWQASMSAAGWPLPEQAV
ncbi:YciI family protein [Undibacterium luofuense]|uniref:GTP cyclohydrolase n=1 Tax=Undibacterium luofuense TaxID=2828733 RepID=A0A941I9H4_9BURK|nr:YciI family protein [Undibacterium luofuense]MBR7783833.1 GTP cyclohydrolase [Undibacterium luofuense]